MAGTHTTSRSTGIADSTTSSESGSSKVGELAEKGKDAAGTAASTIKEQSTELQNTAKTKLAEKANDSRKVAADKARDMEGDLRDIVDTVKDKQPQVGDALERALDSASSLVEYVETTPINEIATDLQRQAKRHPWFVVGGMFAVGFVMSRAMKPVDGVISGSGSTTGRSSSMQGSTPAMGTGTVSGQLPQTTGTPVHI